MLAALVLLGCAAGFAARGTVDGGIRRVAALDPSSDAITGREAQTGDQNVLVLGLPANRSGTPDPQRSDTAVLLHEPAGGGPGIALDLPASLEVSRPPCQRWDPATAGYGDTVPAESRTAFSAAYDVGGPRCTVGVVQQLTGLVVTRFVAIELAGTQALVDAVGGVTICTERAVVDRALGPVVPAPGRTTLDGPGAARFASAVGADDTSTANRVQRQQRVLADALGRGLSTTSLLTPGTAGRVADALARTVTVNDATGSDGTDVEDLLALARTLSGAGDDAATPFLTVPVNDQPNTRGHLEARRSESSELFAALRKHEPPPPDATTPVTAALPAGTVDVLNGAGRPGLAGEVAGALRAQGFPVGRLDDAPDTPDTVIRFSADRADAARVLAGSVPGARSEPDQTGVGTLQLVLGTSFPGATAVTAPARPASAPGTDCG